VTSQPKQGTLDDIPTAGSIELTRP